MVGIVRAAFDVLLPVRGGNGAAIQETINRANDMNGGLGVAVAVPDGTFPVDSEIIVPSGVSLVMGPRTILSATEEMDAVISTPHDDRHQRGLIQGGKIDCNSLASRGLYLKAFSNFRVLGVEVDDQTGRAIELGHASAASSSYEFIGRDIWVKRAGVFDEGDCGIYFANCGDSHISDTGIIGQEIGVDGGYADSKITRVHVWGWGPTNGVATIGFRNTQVDTIYSQCQVDGPISSRCYDIGGNRNVLIGCSTNNVPPSGGGTDGQAACVYVAANKTASVIGCTFKGRSDATWASDIDGGSGAIITAVANQASYCTLVNG